MISKLKRASPATQAGSVKRGTPRLTSAKRWRLAIRWRRAMR